VTFPSFSAVKPRLPQIYRGYRRFTVFPITVSLSIPNRDGLGLGTVALALTVFGLGLDQLALALSVLALLTSLLREKKSLQ